MTYVSTLNERTIHTILNIIVNVGYMNVSERILKLMRYSSRKIHFVDNVDVNDVDGGENKNGGKNKNNITTSTTLICPPPNAITYSILLKGYGQSGPSSSTSKSDAISRLLTIALSTDIETVKPDIVLYNTLINAYVESNRVDLAYVTYRETPLEKRTVKTCNIMMKGFMKVGDLKGAEKLMDWMLYGDGDRNDNNNNGGIIPLWDAISTNTFIQTALNTKPQPNFDICEQILEERTVGMEEYKRSATKRMPLKQSGAAPLRGWRGRGTPMGYHDQRGGSSTSSNTRSTSASTSSPSTSTTTSSDLLQTHPNIEAYTSLLDAYAKSGRLHKALNILQIMRKRGVRPNVYTYTCMIGALGMLFLFDFCFWRGFCCIL